MKSRYLQTLITTTIVSSFVIWSNISQAQIKPDSTLQKNTRIRLEENIKIIEGGTRAGGNLFHSMQHFSVPSGITAYFNNPLDIQNIITRITGNSISNIDGLIRTNGISNLFLMNPNGIIFGENARLNIGGSFVATTATNINFADGFQFSTINRTSKQMLTVNIPVGLSFNGENGAIYVKNTGHNLKNEDFRFPLNPNRFSNGWQVNFNKNLAFIGGEIVLDGGIISTNTGKIELGSVDTGEVNINLEKNNFTFKYDHVVNFQDIKFLQNSLAYVSSLEGEGNTINIQGKKIQISDGSLVFSQNHGSKQDGKISINATENLTVKGASPFGISGIYTSNFGKTPGENIEINSKQVDIEGAQIAANTFSNFSSGNIVINPTELLRVAGSNPSPGNSNGYGGINTFSYINFGDGGNIRGNTKKITLEKRGNISTISSSFGNAGQVNLTAKNISLKDGSSLGSTTFNMGKGGDVLVNASNFIEIIGRSTSVGPSTINVATFGSGDAGKLEINTSNLFIRDGAAISTNTVSFGNAGQLTINTSESLEISGKNLDSNLASSISSSANILDDSLRIRFSRVPLIPTGDAGELIITTGDLYIQDFAQISVRNDGSGNAGILQIDADSINISKQGGITATTAVGQGGDILLQSKDVRLNNSIISATAGQTGTTGDGGNININTDTLLALENSSITANAFEGRGGNIQINTQGFFLSPDSRVTASSERGVDGTIEINTSSIDFTKAALIPSVVEVPQVTNVCAAYSQGESGELVIKPATVPQNPGNLNSLSGWEDKEDYQEKTEELSDKTSQKLVEAQGWKSNPYGTISFTSTPNDVVPYGSSTTPPCVNSSHSQTND
ncbi:filamentous hemagglutinin N-terminal domain-containing protein [Nodularia spumigena]|uniref:two-partner secretion domain-containing protein n=1 Tax=Nodularia spumigena TaxID=70799 RepID=UPI000D318E16|nr:filamentous hemagglutinin N-terminal domain-containing protein [Nodularia spumigena]